MGQPGEDLVVDGARCAHEPWLVALRPNSEDDFEALFPKLDKLRQQARWILQIGRQKEQDGISSRRHDTVVVRSHRTEVSSVDDDLYAGIGFGNMAKDLKGAVS